MHKHAVGRSPEAQAITHFIGQLFCRATVPASEHGVRDVEVDKREAQSEPRP